VERVSSLRTAWPDAIRRRSFCGGGRGLTEKPIFSYEEGSFAAMSGEAGEVPISPAMEEDTLEEREGSSYCLLREGTGSSMWRKRGGRKGSPGWRREGSPKGDAEGSEEQTTLEKGVLRRDDRVTRA